MTLNKFGTVLRRIASWIAWSIVSIVALVVVYNMVRPYTWHEMVIDTGNERIIYAHLEFCGKAHDIDVKPGLTRGQFPDLCEGSATATLATANDQYWCRESYVPAGWPASTFLFKIDSGKCESVGERKRGPLKRNWRAPPEP